MICCGLEIQLGLALVYDLAVATHHLKTVSCKDFAIIPLLRIIFTIINVTIPTANFEVLLFYQI
jgi:hypothetical protein